MVAQLTVSEAELFPEPSLPVVTNASLFKPGHSALVVVTVTVTVKVEASWVVPPGTVTGPQFRVCAPAAPVTAHVLFQPAPWALTAHRLVVTGSGSFNAVP